MSIIDILTRVDSIVNKYDKYDIDKQKDSNVSGDDPFAKLYAAVDADIDAALQVSFRSPSLPPLCTHILNPNRLKCFGIDDFV